MGFKAHMVVVLWYCGEWEWRGWRRRRTRGCRLHGGRSARVYALCAGSSSAGGPSPPLQRAQPSSTGTPIEYRVGACMPRVRFVCAHCQTALLRANTPVTCDFIFLRVRQHFRQHCRFFFFLNPLYLLWLCALLSTRCSHSPAAAAQQQSAVRVSEGGAQAHRSASRQQGRGQEGQGRRKNMMRM
jgi:hypothetical protein